MTSFKFLKWIKRFALNFIPTSSVSFKKSNFTSGKDNQVQQLELTQQMKDNYEEFLVEIDMLLIDLQELLTNSNQYKNVQVNFDDSTLNWIEAFYLDTLSEKEQISISHARMNRIFIAYVGEAVRKRAGGQWALCDVKGDPAFGTPVIINWAPDGIRISPVERRELLIKDRKPFLRELIDYCVNKEEFEKNFFKEFE